MIDQYPPANGVLTSLIWRKTAVGGETSLSGYDNASQALSYTPGQEQVYLNGILLVRGSDYTATNGTSITGLTALAADDFVQINCYNNFSVASVPTTSLTGEVTNSQITSLATTKLTGTITNAQLAGSIANDKLANSSITINGSAVALGGSATIAGGSAQDSAPSSPTEGQLWLDTDGTLATTEFVEKSVLTTTGDLLYASSANTPARIGIGSTSQVLTVSGGVPAWATPASGGMTLLSTTTLSGTSTNITSINGSYTDLLVLYRGMYLNTADQIELKPNNQNTLNTSSGTYGNAAYVMTEIRSIWNLPTTQDDTIGGYLYIYGYAGTTYGKPFHFAFANSANAVSFGGCIRTASAISSINVTTPGGTATYSGGQVLIYGVK